MISGDENTEPADYVAAEWLAGKRQLLALSVGCGTGREEVRWARTGRFRRIDAYDLSEPRIREAARYAKAEGCADKIRFHAADVRELKAPKGTYDVVIAEGALHHLSPLADVISFLESALKPGGYLVLKDFVGPSRFQWTGRQLEAVDCLLAVLPERYRRRWMTGTVKRRFFRPSRLSMLLSDPSEAAESSRILPLLSEWFEPVERTGIGGTLLHLLFNDIAHNFLSEDAESRRLLRLCFAAEDKLLASRELASDFVFGVFRKRMSRPNPGGGGTGPLDER